MKRLTLALIAGIAAATPVSAHPAPFSYLDVSVMPERVEVAVVAHVFDVAHDLGVGSSEALLDPEFVRDHASDIAALLLPRFQIEADGGLVSCRSTGRADIVAARQSVRSGFSCALPHAAGAIGVRALMFP